MPIKNISIDEFTHYMIPFCLSGPERAMENNLQSTVTLMLGLLGPYTFRWAVI